MATCCSSVAPADNAFGLVVIGDESHSDHRHRDRLLHRSGERHLIAGADGNLLARIQPPAGDMDCIATAGLQGLGECDGLADVPAGLDPVGARHADRDRPVSREGGAHCVENLEREPHAILQRPPILVLPPVRKRREEFMQEVPMRDVDLDRIQPYPARAPRGGGERFTEAIHR